MTPRDAVSAHQEKDPANNTEWIIRVFVIDTIYATMLFEHASAFL